MHGVLALFIRSLREQMRAPSFAWVRGGMSFAILITLVFTQSEIFHSGAPGLEFFEPFAWYNVVLICIAAVSYFAGAITEEKEEDTLGLLRMSGMTALSVLLGKGGSRLASGLLLLAVQFPFALLSVTLGGLAWAQVGIVYLLLGAFLFFCANAALFASVVCRSSGLAGVVTGAIIWASFIAGEAAIYFNLSLTMAPSVLEQALSLAWPSAPWRDCSLAMLIAGAVFFLAALLLFNRCACAEADRPSAGKRRGWLAWLRQKPGRASSGRAIQWKDFHFIHGGWRVFTVKCVLYFAGFVWIMVENSPNRSEEFIAITAFLATTAVSLETAFAASRIYRVEAKHQTLASLTTLPLSVEEFMKAKSYAMLHALIPAGIYMVTFGGIGLLMLLTATSRDGTVFFVFICILSGLPAEFLFHYRFIAWLSLRLKWAGLPLGIIISWFGHLLMASMLFAVFQVVTPLMMSAVLWILAVVMKARLQNAIRAATEQS